jgi:hypothetical protein
MPAVIVDDLVNIRFHTILVTVQDAPVQALLRRHLGGWIGGSGSLGLRPQRLEVRNVTLQRVWAAVEDQIFSQLTLLIRDIGVRRDVRRVDDRVQSTCTAESITLLSTVGLV